MLSGRLIIMGRVMNLKTIAGFVEDPNTLNKLTEIGEEDIHENSAYDDPGW
ncbi:MAG: hypothetical protein BMS9Abin33_0488 [Gammaproteobacteria bacterium]|nr:MAG: hypothetical protein BMS9Abin33_0488 [Gammaproteobacteria bacterium]